MVRFSQESNQFKRNITGKPNEDTEQWLNRSLVCTTSELCEIAALSGDIIDGYDKCSRIAALSSTKFILTFPTLEVMQDALSKPEELNRWLVEIKRWSVYETCDSRRVWLGIYDVPPHGWMWENFKNIAEIWGTLIRLGRSTSSPDSLKSCRPS